MTLRTCLKSSIFPGSMGGSPGAWGLLLAAVVVFGGCDRQRRGVGEAPPPEARPGQSMAAAKNTPVTLDGSASSGRQGNNLIYTWSQISGPPVALEGADTPTPRFVSPGRAGELTFGLRVSDGIHESDETRVSVTVGNPLREPPTAEVRRPQSFHNHSIFDAGFGTPTVNGGETLMLDGSPSRDPDGGALSFFWSQTGSGPRVRLSNPHTPRPSFLVPNQDATLHFELVVKNGDSPSPPARVRINTLAYRGEANPLWKNPFWGGLTIAEQGFAHGVWQMATHAQTAYLAAGWGGFQVVDLSLPTHPRLLGKIAPASLLGGFINTGVAVVWPWAYVAEDYNLINAINITDPARPIKNGPLILGDAQRLAAVTTPDGQTYVFALGGFSDSPANPRPGRISVLRPDPDHPGGLVLVTSLDTGGEVNNVAALGNTVWLANGQRGLKGYDLASLRAAPPALVETANLATPGPALDVAVNGDYAFVASAAAGLAVVRISRDGRPLAAPILERVEPLGDIRQVTVSDGRLVAAGGTTLFAYTLFSGGMTLAGKYTAPGAVTTLAALPATAGVGYVVVGQNTGLATLRTLPPSFSLPLGATDELPPAAQPPVVAGNHLFLTGPGGLTSINGRNPLAPVRAGVVQTESRWSSCLAPWGDYLVVCAGNKLEIMDIANPVLPVRAASLSTAALPVAVAVENGIAYVAENAGSTNLLEIVDVTNPALPALISTYRHPGQPPAVSMVVSGHTVVLAHQGGEGVVSILDCSNPARVTQTGTITLPGQNTLAGLDQGRLVMANSRVGMVIQDISNPAHPRQTGAYRLPFPNSGGQAALAGGYAIFSRGADPLLVLDISGETPTLAGQINQGADWAVPLGEYMIGQTPAAAGGVHINPLAPALFPLNASAPAETRLDYTLTFPPATGGETACFVTGGVCRVNASGDGGSAVIHWWLPPQPGDHELLIAVGDGNRFSTAKDRVRVE
ncbi:MAG: hypothetical protein OEW12_07140 [Deltaproteobacteria bacterium]|nr:hypothetical protein [Deltaproteobacteria bacterium]